MRNFIRIAALAIAVASLAGCAVYVGPAHGYRHHCDYYGRCW